VGLRRYLVEQREAGGADGPTRSYAVGENALDEINSQEMQAFIDGVRPPLLIWLAPFYAIVEVPSAMPGVPERSMVLRLLPCQHVTSWT
jgi:hypothetical protein